MKRQPINKRAVAAGILAALLLVLVQPAKAILGFGDIVFDPSSYATLGKIFTSDASVLQKTIQTFNETVKIYTNALQMYQLAMAMSQHFSHPQKASWMTVAQTAANDYTRNSYGETVLWPQMVNGRPALATLSGPRPQFPLRIRATYREKSLVAAPCSRTWPASRRRTVLRPSASRQLLNTAQMQP
jgi:hypothetical protein